MHRVSMVLFPLVLIAGALAQQAKPSAAQPATPRTELKQSSKTEATAKTEAPAKPVASPTLPVGTPIWIKLETPLYTGSTKEGDTFHGRLTHEVKLNDKVVLPVGASLEGHVARVSESRRFKGKPMIQLHPESVVLPNGQKLSLSAAVVDTNDVNGTSVDQEGRIKGPGHTNGDLIEMGAGTGAGAVIGGLAGGGKGSLIGAGIGAGATAIHWLTKRNYAYIPAGSEIIFELSHPMIVAVSQI